MSSLQKRNFTFRYFRLEYHSILIYEEENYSIYGHYNEHDKFYLEIGRYSLGFCCMQICNCVRISGVANSIIGRGGGEGTYSYIPVLWN